MRGEKGLDVNLTVLDAWQLVGEAHVAKLVNWWLSRRLPFPYHPDTRRLSKRIDGVTLLRPWAPLIYFIKIEHRPCPGSLKAGRAGQTGPHRRWSDVMFA